MFGQRIHALDCAQDRLLPVHFGIEKQIEQAPDFGPFDRAAIVGIAHRLAEIVVLHVEIYAVKFGNEVLERRDHVQQHFVAIADHQRAALFCHRNFSHAAAIVSGAISRSCAAATRSVS